jgi:hypothetical protein
MTGPRTMRDPRAMSDGRDVEVRDFADGPPGPGHPAIDHALEAAAAAAVRHQHTNTQRRALAAGRDMTPGAPHPDPRLAASGWQASGHGTYVRKPPEPEREAE